MYRLKSISLNKGKSCILRDISLEIMPNRFTMIAGRNGAGKSSLLRILTGEETEYAGEVTFLEKHLNTYRTEDLSTLRSVLPQQPQNGFSFTALQIIELGAFPYKIPAHKLNHQIDKLAIDLKIKHLIHRQVSTLSGGERQKVHLCRVMLQSRLSNSPSKVILLDEPANNLDLTHQHEIYSILRRSNATIIAIVHDINMAVRYADDLIFLSEGNVLASGPSSQCLDPELLLQVLGHPVTVLHHPCSDCPLIVPQINQHKHNGKQRSLIT